MTYCKQPLRIEIAVCPFTGCLFEYPVWSDDDIDEGNALLDEVLQGAKENNVKPQYYIQEFV